jgi:hypothetical protein
MRAIYFVAISIMLVGNAQLEAAIPAVGDRIDLQLNGDLAREYATRSSSMKQLPSGMTISIIATIAELRSDGKYRIEHTALVKTDDKPKMVTLTSIVDPKDVAVDIIPKNTPVYSDPGGPQRGDKPSMTQSEQKILRLNLSALDGTKLRTWALVDEIGH